MGTTARLLAAGPGWRVNDVLCTAGPQDKPFEEQHEAACIAMVLGGTFQYRTTQGSAVLAPGALLLGNHQHCFECGHEHAAGDRCLAFHFAPDWLERFVADVPGARRTTFAAPLLPPLASLARLIAAAEAARDDADAEMLAELAVQLAGAVMATLAANRRSGPVPTARDARRVTEALRWIEAHAEDRLPLDELARRSSMSPYHFLRTFRSVTGLTPHQYVLRTRMHRAAVRLRLSDEPVSAIAFDAGFNDLSTFNRRFLRVMHQTPGAFRARG